MKVLKLFERHGSNVTFGIIVFILAMMPVLLMLGVVSSGSTLLFLGKCISFAIVAIGIDLIWGYTGILSLGHGLYFALGGYAMAMYLKMQATGGQITDFMHIGGLTELPFVWEFFTLSPGSLLFVVIAPAVVAWIVGYFIFGSIKGSANQGNMFLLFYVAIIALVAIYALSKFLVERKFGKVLIAIRDGENRTYFSGYPVSRYKTFIYVLSAAFAGVAGAIFVNFNGCITPSQMTITYSIGMVIWVAIGGRGTIIGAVIGAFFINICEYNLSSGSTVEVWQYIIGILFCVTILFFKGGIVGLVQDKAPKIIAKIRTGKVKA